MFSLLALREVFGSAGFPDTYSFKFDYYTIKYH